MSDPSSDALIAYGDEQFSEGFDCGWVKALSAIRERVLEEVHHPGSRWQVVKALDELEEKVNEHRAQSTGKRG
jgi:hypothetical protein